MRARRAGLVAVAVAVAAALALFACAHPRPAPRHVAVTAPIADDISIAWVGHATVLVGIHGHWFLTDPVLGDRIARVYPRKVQAAIRADELPPLDAILISHAHFDHLDRPSLRAIAPAPVVVPPGARSLVDDLPGHPPIALATGATWRPSPDVAITAVPASHGDGRYGVDLWRRDAHTGYVIQVGERTVYFAGDTGYVPAQARALARYAIDVALIPVGPAGRAAWIERWRARVHATPDAALALFRDTGARYMVPIHFGTFFGSPDRERPLIEQAIARAHLAARVRTLDIGATALFR